MENNGSRNENISPLDELRNIEKAVDLLQARISSLDQENQELKKFNQSLEGIVKDLESKTRHLEEEFIDKVDENTNSEVAELREMIKSLEIKNESLNYKCAVLERRNNDLELLNEKLAGVDVHSNIRTDFKSTLDSLKTKLGLPTQAT